MQVRKRSYTVGKINGIIPKVNVVCKFTPISYIFHKGLTCWIAFDAFTAVKFDGTKHNLNIISWFGYLWSSTRKLVSQGRNGFIRKFFRKLAGDRGDEFADIILKTVGNVVKGIIGVALILALLHGILFMLAGVPYAGIWTLLAFVLAVLQIPLFFITVPVIIYMFATKDLMPAIMWTALIFVAGLSDNVLKPILLGKGAPVPMLVIFIGVIGGFIFSGFIGLFTGAIVMSIGYKLFVAWINSAEEAEQPE